MNKFEEVVIVYVASLQNDSQMRYGKKACLNQMLRSHSSSRSSVRKYLFLQQTILWYMSKEIEETSFESTTRLPTSQVSQVYSFWATLMSTGEASSDLCQYPSQSSILSRNGDPAWQPLVLNRTIEPPVVELLDGA